MIRFRIFPKETHPKFDETIKDNEVNIPGYVIVCRAKVTYGIGGVYFKVKSSINFTTRNDLNIDNLENLCLEIQKARCKPFVVFT